jgi:hypothetical protein
MDRKLLKEKEKEFFDRFGIPYSQFKKKPFSEQVRLIMEYVGTRKEDLFSYAFLSTLNSRRSFEDSIENALFHATENFEVFYRYGEIPWKKETYEKYLRFFIIHYEIFALSKEELRKLLPNLAN